MNGRNAEPQSARNRPDGYGADRFSASSPEPGPRRPAKSYHSEYDEPSSAVPGAPLFTS